MIITLTVDAPMRCGFCPANAIALVRWDVDGHSYREWRYCVDHLNKMFDAVDAIGMKTHGHLNSEPTHVTWIRHPGSRWCPTHNWHRLLCDTWWHGPNSDRFGQDQVTLWESRQRATRATVASPDTMRGDG